MQFLYQNDKFELFYVGTISMEVVPVMRYVLFYNANPWSCDMPFVKAIAHDQSGGKAMFTIWHTYEAISCNLISSMS